VSKSPLNGARALVCEDVCVESMADRRGLDLEAGEERDVRVCEDLDIESSREILLFAQRPDIDIPRLYNIGPLECDSVQYTTYRRAYCFFEALGSNPIKSQRPAVQQ